MSDTDNNFQSYANVENVEIPEGAKFAPVNDVPYDDILKFSNSKWVHGKGLIVVGGTENAIDINNKCEGITLEDCKTEGGGNCAVVIKGGSKNIILRNFTITPAPTAKYDIELGGWSDQSFDTAKSIILENVFRNLDGVASKEPVRVIIGRAEKPLIIGGNVKIDHLRSLGFKAFWWSKRLGRLLHLV